MSRSLTVVPLFGIACTAALFCGLYYTGTPFSWPFALLLVYFTLVTLVLLLWQERKGRTDVKGFIRRFMAGMVIKLMGSMLLLFILLKVVPKETASPLAVSFALLYLSFLAFSTIRLVHTMRSSNDHTARS